MKIAIVHDWLYGGGAEKVVEEIHRIYPDAPVYATFATDEWRKKLDGQVRTGYLGKWPFRYLYKFTPLLQQRWFSSLDLSGYDLVISSCGNGAARFALSKNKRPGQVHISYTHTPTHYYWRKYEEYLKNPSFKPKWLARLGLKILVGQLKKKDYEAAQKIDYLIANSEHIKQDIKNYYGRDSVVVHPPVDTLRFAKNMKPNGGDRTGSHKKHSFVMWGRLVPYKRFDIAVLACNQLQIPLTIIGNGPDKERLMKLAGDTVSFKGWVTEDEMLGIASEASAFIAPQEEDFGIAPVEALAAGLPVIAYKSGGALDYVTSGENGLFFEEQTVESLVNALSKFVEMNFAKELISKKAHEKFSTKRFHEQIAKFVESKISD